MQIPVIQIPTKVRLNIWSVWIPRMEITSQVHHR